MMVCPYVKTFCFCFSVKTGAMLIMFFNFAYSFFGFVAWVSTGAIIFVTTRKDDNYDSYRTSLAVALHVAVGILLTVVETYMSFLLHRALQKDDPKYLRWFLGIGAAVVAVNMVTTALASVYFTSWIAIYPGLIGIPLQTYFLLVIRSAHREMMLELVLTHQRQRPDLGRTASNLSNATDTTTKV